MKVLEKDSTEHAWIIGDWGLIEFYFLLRIEEYAITSYKKEMRRLILRDIVFFNKDKGVNLSLLGQKATDKKIIEAYGATVRLVNKKIWHKTSCIHHEKN